MGDVLSREKHPLQQLHSNKGGGRIFEGRLITVIGHKCAEHVAKTLTRISEHATNEWDNVLPKGHPGHTLKVSLRCRGLSTSHSCISGLLAHWAGIVLCINGSHICQLCGGPASSQGSGEIWIGNEAPPSSQAYKEKHVFSSYQIGLIPFPPYTTAQEANIGPKFLIGLQQDTPPKSLY